MALDPVMQLGIPFLFVFAVVFGVLEITLKGWTKPIKAVIAFALSLFAITYSPFTNILWAQMGNILLFFIVMFFIVFIREIIGFKKTDNPIERMVITGAILLLLLTLGWSIVDFIDFDIPILGDKEDLFLLIGIIVVIAIFDK